MNTSLPSDYSPIEFSVIRIYIITLVGNVWHIAVIGARDCIVTMGGVLIDITQRSIIFISDKSKNNCNDK